MNNALIISYPRSGSTNLMKSIASAYNLKYGFEKYRGTQIIKYTKIVNKDIIDLRTNKEWINEIKKYDKVVLLGRKDIIQAAESLYVVHNMRNTNIMSTWSEEEITNKDISQELELYHKFEKQLKELSSLTNIPIDWYEDIYANFTLKDTTIKLDTSFLDSKLKLRVNSINKSII